MIKGIHDFIRQFDKKDKNGKLIESGYQFIAKVQKEILDKYHEPDKVVDLIGEEQWKHYKNLMKREKDLRLKEKTI